MLAWKLALEMKQIMAFATHIYKNKKNGSIVEFTEVKSSLRQADKKIQTVDPVLSNRDCSRILFLITNYQVAVQVKTSSSASTECTIPVYIQTKIMFLCYLEID